MPVHGNVVAQCRIKNATHEHTCPRQQTIIVRRRLLRPILCWTTSQPVFKTLLESLLPQGRGGEGGGKSLKSIQRSRQPLLLRVKDTFLLLRAIWCNLNTLGLENGPVLPSKVQTSERWWELWANSLTTKQTPPFHHHYVCHWSSAVDGS